MGLLLATAGAACAQHEEEGAGLSGDQALARLMEGNARYAGNKEQHPDESLARRRELEGGQHPFATILSCSDSRGRKHCLD